MIYDLYVKDEDVEFWKWVATIYGCTNEAEAVAYGEKLISQRSELLWKLEKRK